MNQIQIVVQKKFEKALKVYTRYEYSTLSRQDQKIMLSAGKEVSGTRREAGVPVNKMPSKDSAEKVWVQRELSADHNKAAFAKLNADLRDKGAAPGPGLPARAAGSGRAEPSGASHRTRNPRELSRA